MTESERGGVRDRGSVRERGGKGVGERGGE